MGGRKRGREEGRKKGGVKVGGGAGKYGDRGQILGVSSEEEVGGLSCSPRQVSDTTVVEVGEVGKGSSLLSVIQQYRIETCHSIHHPVREAEGERREGGREKQLE